MDLNGTLCGLINVLIIFGKDEFPGEGGCGGVRVLCRIKIRHYNLVPSLPLCNPCSLEAINAASSKSELC